MSKPRSVSSASTIKGMANAVPSCEGRSSAETVRPAESKLVRSGFGIMGEGRSSDEDDTDESDGVFLGVCPKFEFGFETDALTECGISSSFASSSSEGNSRQTTSRRTFKK